MTKKQPSSINITKEELDQVMKYFALYLNGSKKTYSFEEVREMRRKKGMDV